MFWFVMFIIVITIAGFTYVKWHDYKVTLTAEQKKALGGPKLSHVSKQLLKEYNELPVESRPFPDITNVLVALDIKHNIDADKRDKHFNDNYYYYLDQPKSVGGYKFSWKADGAGGCSHQRYCKFGEYFQLHNDIEAVKRSIAETEREIALAQYDRNDLVVLTSRLRDEVRIQNEVRKELS